MHLLRTEQRIYPDDLARENGSEQGENPEQDGQVPKDLAGKVPSPGAGFVAQVSAEQRNKGSAERAFRGHTAYHAGNAKGQNEGIGGRRGSQKQGDALVP